MLQVLNILFFVFHTFWIVLVLFGWMVSRTLRLNLIAIILTTISWIGLGYWFGWGYCLCTDWHWQVRRGLGIVDHTNNYVHFLINKLTGIEVSSETMMLVVAIAFILASIMSIRCNLKIRKPGVKG